MVVDLNLDHCGTDLNKVFHCARSAGLNRKSSREVCHCWDVLQIWRDWFDEKFGELRVIRHRSPPYDPPDLELVFAGETVAFEDTRLQPEHIGRADALRNREIAPDVCTAVPAISKPIKNNKTLIERMLCIPQSDVWTNVSEEHAALARLLAERVKKKMDRLPIFLSIFAMSIGCIVSSFTRVMILHRYRTHACDAADGRRSTRGKM